MEGRREGGRGGGREGGEGGREGENERKKRRNENRIRGKSFRQRMLIATHIIAGHQHADAIRPSAVKLSADLHLWRAVKELNTCTYRQTQPHQQTLHTTYHTLASSHLKAGRCVVSRQGCG